MKKNFTFVLPDEPYTNKTTLNNVINAVYEGPKYLICRVNKTTRIVEGVVREADDLETLANTPAEEGYDHITLNADVNTFEAAYLTDYYTHDVIEDPTFILPRGLGEWTYHYDDYTGGINQAFYQFTLKFQNNVFSKPEYRLHALTRESVMAGSKVTAKAIRDSLKNSDHSTEDRTTLEEYATWLENLEETYHDVEHWKIPFPTTVPKY
jgi:hypothetical protein